MLLARKLHRYALLLQNAEGLQQDLEILEPPFAAHHLFLVRKLLPCRSALDEGRQKKCCFSVCCMKAVAVVASLKLHSTHALESDDSPALQVGDYYCIHPHVL